MKDLITAPTLREVLSYDRDTGIFTWVAPLRRGRMQPGDIAGTVTAKGYVKIGVHGRSYFAHRLAWLHETGEWPEQEIDHINRRRDDNRFANLRCVSHRENQYNRCDNRWMTVAGKTLAMEQWAAETGVNAATIRSRLEKGLSDVDALRPVT